MRLSIEDLEKKRAKTTRARAIAKVLSSGEQKGSKPRSEAETIALTRATVNRVKKAIEQGILDLSKFKSERRIIIRIDE